MGKIENAGYEPKSIKMKFTKTHGLGNDFIIFDSLEPDKYNLKNLAVKLCNRYTGIGADGILLVLPSDKADIKMRIINSDGSEPNMCGNAIRCFAKYVAEKQIIKKNSFSIETYAGIIKPELVKENGVITLVKVNMGAPLLERKAIPMLGSSEKVINESIEIDNSIFHITSMLMSVPHTILYVENVETIDVEKIGKKIEKACVFPEGTNVNFVEIINSNEIKVRTWERGAGATLACGTGSCAAVVSSVLNNKTNSKVKVHLALGELEIEWKDSIVYMTGPAELVFSSDIEINKF